MKAELVHSVNEDLSLIGGCSFASHPSTFSSLAVSFLKYTQLLKPVVLYFSFMIQGVLSVWV